MRRPAVLCLLALACAGAAPDGRAVGRPDVAALQVALRAKGLYRGDIDGVAGPRTAAAVRRFLRRAGLSVDGIAGPKTRRRLCRIGHPALGSRVLATGMVVWYVAVLQFQLAWHGFRSGEIDGIFGPRLLREVRRFQRWVGLHADGRAGPQTLRALRRPLPRSPIRLAWPMRLAVADRFGPRGDRFHAGVDFPASPGMPVRAAAPGRVVFAGWHRLGYGRMVAVLHRRGVKTRYAHLSRVVVSVGERVSTRTVIGRVGSSGFSTGPHLHFEVRVRGAAVDPLTALG